jgi:hypothetical protein
MTKTPPSGFSAVSGGYANNTANNVELTIYSHIAASDGTSYTFTGLSGSNFAFAVCQAFRNTSATPIDVVAATSNGGGSHPIAPALSGLSGTTDMLTSWWTYGSAGGVTIPADEALGFATDYTGGSHWGVAGAYKLLNTANPGTETMAGPSQSVWASISIALHPQ